MSRPARRVAVALGAALACVATAVVAGLRIEGYSHLVHPAGVLGARQLGAAGLAFGLLACVVPGLAHAWQAVHLRAALPPASSLAARTGMQLLLLAALAFAAQGILRLDLESLDSGPGRWHASAWLGWALAFPAGATLAGLGAWRQRGWRPACAGLLVAGAAVACGALLDGGAAAPLLQRAAALAWLLWGVWAALHAPFSRGAASAPGSPAQGPG